jgi:3-oxoadipate enol-lactonase
MPFAQANGINIHYRIDGPADAPVIVLSNSIGTDLSVWDEVAEGLQPAFRVLRYDGRGHGKSDVPNGPYTLEMLGADVIGLLDRLDLTKVDFCGLSLGAMVGMWAAANHPARLGRLVLCNTAASVPPPQAWNARIDAVRGQGMQAIRPAVLERWISQEFRARDEAAVARLLNMVQASPAEGYIGACAAIRDTDQRHAIRTISAPTLVVAGNRDIATTPEDLRFIAANIPGSAYVEIDCGHLSNLEKPRVLSAKILEFLT